MSDIKKWYNEYVASQQKVGINARHRSILKWLKKFGLKKNHSVLEIGCGIGTVTGLLAKYLSSPKQITATDISDESINAAKKRLNKFEKINWIAGDFLSTEITGVFDVILLPDVLEHIPLEQHYSLFSKLNRLLKTDGFVFIHIPYPNYLEWCKKHIPETLQIIDQPLHLNLLANNIYQNNFFIKHLETYSIWMKPADYQAMVLKKSSSESVFLKDNSFKNKISKRIPL
jgi:2-polyprenyl-3-methyl-5-hydroxy-6-metoxy-1,4-benzoquinol methylase